MFDDIINNLNQYFRQDPEGKKRVKVLLAICLLLIAVFIFWPRKNYPKYKVIDLNTSSSESGSYTSGSNIYSYNGVSFNSVGIDKDSTPRVLYSGLKLPKPKDIIWASDRGALISFKGPLGATDIDKKLRSMGLSPNKSTEEYIWYIDFKDGSINQFREGKIDPKKLVYSKEDSGFYYSALAGEQNPDSSGKKNNSILFYDIESKQSKTYASNILSNGIVSLNKCKDSSGKVCFVSKDDSSSSAHSLYSVDSSGSPARIASVRGGLMQTSNPDFYLTYVVDEERDAKAAASKSEDSYVPQEIALFQVSTLKSKSTGITLIEPNPSLYVGELSDGKRSFYLLDNSLSKPYSPGSKPSPFSYISGEIKDEDLSVSHKTYEASLGKELFTGRYINSNGFADSQHSGGSTLSTKTAGTIYFGPVLQDLKHLETLPEGEQKKVVESCMEEPSVNVQYSSGSREFTVVFSYGDDIGTKIKEFSSCLEKKDPRALNGYNFTVKVRDPATDRFI